MAVDPVPPSSAPPPSTLWPYLVVDGAAAAIAFYREAFGAEEIFRLVDPGDGRIGHAELRIAGYVVMLSDEYPDFGAVGPHRLGGSPVRLQLYVPDVEVVFSRAIAAGAQEIRPVKPQFYGDRTGMLADPFGHVWMIATRVEDVPPAEMQRRWSDAVAG